MEHRRVTFFLPAAKSQTEEVRLRANEAVLSPACPRNACCCCIVATLAMQRRRQLAGPGEGQCCCCGVRDPSAPPYPPTPDFIVCCCCRVRLRASTAVQAAASPHLIASILLFLARWHSVKAYLVACGQTTHTSTRHTLAFRIKLKARSRFPAPFFLVLPTPFSTWDYRGKNGSGPGQPRQVFLCFSHHHYKFAGLENNGGGSGAAADYCIGVRSVTKSIRLKIIFLPPAVTTIFFGGGGSKG